MNQKELYESLVYKPKNVFETIDENEKKTVFELCDNYKVFLDRAKTERESVCEAIRLAQEKGFVELGKKELVVAGDKVYIINRNKSVLFAIIGTEDIGNGVNIVGAHIDAPRIDIKQNPLYEDSRMALLKTHYYGGIKKYHWTATPLALHGVMYKKDGTCVNIVIGEDETDPVFCITDLLPHLASAQMKKTMSEAISGEELNLLVGGMGIGDSEIAKKVKFNILNILNEKYGITEYDFSSAELEIVPAYKAKDVGLDRSFVGGYAQDDRVCSYTGLKAILDIEAPMKTAICLLVDKEEVGSMGNTGMKSRFFEMALAKIIQKTGKTCDIITLNQVLENSVCLSADVGVAFDPNYPSVADKHNVPYAGNGVIITKYTGSRGKSGASDANAEFVHKIRTIFDESNVIWQCGELGKVDEGGGGTIAQYVANLNIDVIDCGVALLSMHSPFEIASKADVYMTYKAYKAFYMSK